MLIAPSRGALWKQSSDLLRHACEIGGSRDFDWPKVRLVEIGRSEAPTATTRKTQPIVANGLLLMADQCPGLLCRFMAFITVVASPKGLGKLAIMIIRCDRQISPCPFWC